MRELILISILLANVWIPARAARERSARRALRRALVAMLIFDFCYLLAIALVYPRV